MTAWAYGRDGKHDPLCPFYPDQASRVLFNCQCELIAKVEERFTGWYAPEECEGMVAQARADEAKQWVRQVAEASQRVLDQRDDQEARVMVIRGEHRGAITRIEARRALLTSLLADGDILPEEANELACERVGLNFALHVLKGSQ